MSQDTAPRTPPTPGTAARLCSTRHDLDVTVMSVDGDMATVWVASTTQLLQVPLSVLRW